MTENVKGIGLAATSLRLAEGLHASWVKHGFVCAGVASQSAAVLWRKHGELRQMLDIRCMRSTSPGAIRLYVRLGFADERIAATWLPLLPKKYVLRKARFDANSGGVAADIALYLPSLRAGTLPDDATFSTNSDMLIRSLDELDAMLPMMRSWTERELLPMLDRIQSLDDLSGVALSDATLEYCEQGLPEFPVLPGLLVLAARRNAQTLARYAAAYRRNLRLLDLWRLYGDPQGAHFDALLAGLAKAA